MKGRYDDLSSETTWTSDNDRIPQDYLDSVMDQIGKPRKFIHDTNNIFERANIANLAREYGKLNPREGQPDIWSYTNMREWYLEGLRRANEIPLFPYRLA